ncbi:MAG: RHS repeat-associated core domain-containing protein [Verrucomicrobiae bacterium]|nr:RHS repeat-associated core domain-containing protein [Verrucomicrobiae bacterium]
MSSAPSAVNILYDGDGNRVKKTVNGIETYYLVDTVNLTGYAQVMEELTIHDTQPTVSRVFTYGLDLISQERLHDTPTGAIWQARFYGYDGHGNVRFLTDPDGHITDRYDFDAYGNLLAQSGTTANNYLYCGEQFDPDVGLYFLRARYMDTERGRFWTMDVFEGRNFDPASLQKFLYANSAPINYIDPTGQFSLIQVMFTATLIGFLAGCTRPETVKVNTSVIIWEYEPSSDSGAHSAHTWVEWTDKNGNRRSAGFNHPAAPHPKMYISDDPSENDPYAYPFGPYYKVKQIVISSTKYDIEAFIECLDNKAANPPASPQHEHCVDYATKLVDGCLAVSRKR